jgi:hypothetical protein
MSTDIDVEMKTPSTEPGRLGTAKGDFVILMRHCLTSSNDV